MKSLVVVNYIKIRGVGVRLVSWGFLRELGQVVFFFIREVYACFLGMSSYCHAWGIVDVRQLLSPHLQTEIYISAYRPYSWFTSSFIPARISGSTAYRSQNLLLYTCLAYTDFLLPTLTLPGLLAISKLLAVIFYIVLRNVVVVFDCHLSVLSEFRRHRAII